MVQARRTKKMAAMVFFEGIAHAPCPNRSAMVRHSYDVDNLPHFCRNLPSEIPSVSISCRSSTSGAFCLLMSKVEVLSLHMTLVALSG